MKQRQTALSAKPLSNRSLNPIREVDVRPARSQIRAATTDRFTTSPREEALIVDERTAWRPAQVVESKLMRMIKNASLPISHLKMCGILRSRQPAS